MPQIYTDQTGQRVIIRYSGPPGPGLIPGGLTGQIYAKASDDNYDGVWVDPPDGVDSVSGPAGSVVDGHFALFDGTTGTLLKSSGQPMSYFATSTLVATKVDKVTGKVLSANDFTNVLKAKLDALSPSGYRGKFTTEAAIIAIPAPLQGDYALLEVSGSPLVVYFYDSTNALWNSQQIDYTPDSAALAAILFNPSDAYSQSECRILTSLEKSQIASHEAVISSLLGGSSPTAGRQGSRNLVAGTVTVANTAVKANTAVFMTRNIVGGTPGHLSYTVNSGVGFTMNSTSATETSLIFYNLVDIT